MYYALLVLPVTEYDACTREIFLRFARGEAIAGTDPWELDPGKEDGWTFSYRYRCLQGELLRCLFFVSEWPISKELIGDVFKEAVVENDESISVPDEFADKLPGIELQGTVLLADVLSELPRNNTKPASALTHQLWESQSFHVSKVDGPFSAELHPVRTRKSNRLIGGLYNIHLAISVHRVRIQKPVCLYIVLQADAVSLHNRLRFAAGIPGNRIRSDIMDPNYGMLSQLESSPATKEPSNDGILAQAFSTIVIGRPIGLTTSIVENTMYVLLENLSEEFTLILESINTRNSCCGTAMPFELAPGDQYCLPLKFSQELVHHYENSSEVRPQWGSSNAPYPQSDVSSSRAVFPLAIKWRFAGVQGSSAWSQFGANCSTGPPTPIVAILSAEETQVGPHSDGPYKRGLNLTLQNNGEEAVDLVLILLDYGKKWVEKRDVVGMLDESRKTGTLEGRDAVAEKILAIWKVLCCEGNSSFSGYSQWAEASHDVGMIEAHGSRSVSLDLWCIDLSHKPFVPPFFLVECLQSKIVLASPDCAL